MGLFDSSSSSTTNQTQETLTATDDAEAINIETGQTLYGNSNLYVTTTDGGAVSKALGLGKDSLNLADSLFSNVLESFNNVIGALGSGVGKVLEGSAKLSSQSGALAENALQLASDSSDAANAANSRDLSKNIIILSGIAATAFVASVFIKKKG